jgi:betaine-aldehyde dehydrogenase
VDRLAARAKGEPTRSPFAEATEMGPITTRAQHEKVLRILDQARADRLDCVAGDGGGAAADGFFVQPMVYVDVPTSNSVWREEIFGPVLAVRSFRTDAEAIELANDSEYGLVATVVSSDPARAEAVAARIDAGHIWINSLQVIAPNTAWGGFKASGIGRELGPWGLSAYLGVKHLTIGYGSGG